METVSLIFIILVAVLLLRALFSVGRKGGRAARRQVYESRLRLFTPAERSFLGVLDQACAGRYRVLGKVRVADVLSPKKGLSNSNRQTALNRIVAKHVDFVLCDPKTLEVKAAVELHDSSHKRNRRAERDAFLRAAFDNAGVPLIEVPAQRSYTLESIRALLRELEIYQGAEPAVDSQGRTEPHLGS